MAPTPTVAVTSMNRRRRLQWLLGTSSILTVVVLLLVLAAALRAVGENHRAAAHAAHTDLEALKDAAQLQALFYQKGFVANFLLTGDERWIGELDRTRPALERWLAGLTRDASTDATGRATAELVAEYGRYDADRVHAVGQYRAGDRAGAIRALGSASDHAARLRELANHLVGLRREEVEARLGQADRTWRRSLVVLLAGGLLAIAGAAVIGWLLARRIGRPLYELVLRAESAGAGARVIVSESDELSTLGAHVARLAREIESSSAQLAEQRARLAQAEKMSALGEVAAAVAHEVLNPLCGIKTALQVLARDEGSAAAAETVAAVDGEIHRVEVMARRLVDFARPLEPRLGRVPLGALVERVIAATRAEAEARRVRVVAEAGDEVVLAADPDLILQVLVNLVTNACQAMPDGGEVRIGARLRGPWRVVFVRDAGTGLAPSVRARLFTPFVTTRREGHGLGLAIAENIALAHGGHIEAHDNPDGRGTTFEVLLPARPARPARSASVTEPALAGADDGGDSDGDGIGGRDGIDARAAAPAGLRRAAGLR